MKAYIKLYAYCYAIVSVVIFIFALFVNRRFEVTLPIRPLFWGSILISLLIALGINIFKKTWGNGVSNVIIGYLVMVPIPGILKVMFGNYIFQRSFAIYIFGLIYAILYSLVVLYASHKNKKMESKLNELLQEREKETMAD
ncbi:MAG: hypothetical protein Q7I99_00140 [Acholeplasmataceae bacterium]|nr:hypothetical protein [Acholeplasmataceae bacterium]